MRLASPCCWRISFLKRFYINNTFLHLIIYNNVTRKQEYKVNKQLINLIRNNIGLISDPQIYEKCTMKAKKISPPVVNFACYTGIFFEVHFKNLIRTLNYNIVLIYVMFIHTYTHTNTHTYSHRFKFCDFLEKSRN